MYGIFTRFPDLLPYEKDIQLRMDLLEEKKKQLLKKGTGLKDFANAHRYYGIHHTDEGWVYREWAPAAQRLYLTGDFNNWNKTQYPLKKLRNGNWELKLPEDVLHEGNYVKTIVKANGELTEHIPLYATRVVQDPVSRMWSCEVVDDRKTFKWTDAKFKCDEPPLIYESHVGMSSEEPIVNSYRAFADDVLPRIKEDGYNTIQLMAVMEHPYYGSFGYQVSNFFAAASRCGRPEDLKYLINKAHKLGIRVLLDLVHSHAVKNTQEGINMFDGTEYQFFHAGAKGEHPSWGTKVFNYAKPEVIHFLLSNLKFWLEEYHFDGFRFDGVTSMLYHDHAMGTSFSNLSMYFTMNTDTDAVTYLQLANLLIHEVNPNAVTIAEDMSGMPGMAEPVSDGGIGFNYRLAMGQPDMWVKLVKEKRDEDWQVGSIYSELTNRNTPTIAYVESHDQALVGDQTLMFRMCGAEMYYGMHVSNPSMVLERAVALHKMTRLITASAGGSGYLNFMGNEFGHPEWIDFPREGNGYSHEHARRQWSLAENEDLKFKFLGRFDKEMIKLIKDYGILKQFYPVLKLEHNTDHVLAYERGDLLFVFNFHPYESYGSYRIPVSVGDDYEVLLATDDSQFGGFDRTGHITYSSFVPGSTESALQLYLPARTAVVLVPKKKNKANKKKRSVKKAEE